MQLRHYWYLERTGPARSDNSAIDDELGASDSGSIHDQFGPGNWILHRSPPWQCSDQV